jgi:hypothetical protein
VCPRASGLFRSGPDVEVHLDGRDVLVDITVIHPTAPSYGVRHTFRSLAAHKTRTKTRYYCTELGVCHADDFRVFPFCAHGAFGRATTNFMQRLAALRPARRSSFATDIRALLQEAVGKSIARAVGALGAAAWE